MDEQIVLDNLLDRLENHIQYRSKSDAEIFELTRKLRQLEDEMKAMRVDGGHIMRLERFVESDPEIQAKWMDFYKAQTVPKSKSDADIPF